MSEQDPIIEQALRLLGEHFDHVQLLVSWDADSETRFIHSGCGNWYARQGMAHQFINSDMAQNVGHEVAEAMPRAGDEDED